VSSPGYRDDKSAVLARLKRIEGQTRGIHRMIEDDRYCVDVLQQISAVTRALQGVALHLLDEHLSHCVADAITAGGDEREAKLNEASAAIARLVKS
jgi:DNA-binding FrmR family transcriptional regulator